MEARSKNGVVGRTGMNTPIIPNANEVEPINISMIFFIFDFIGTSIIIFISYKLIAYNISYD